MSRITTIVALTIVLGIVAPTAFGDEFEESWILVRLHNALNKTTAAGTLSLDTDSPALNAQIRDEGVHRIDHALSVSMSGVLQPARLTRYGLDRVYRFHVPANSDVEKLVERLSELPQVDYAELDRRLVSAATIPFDPMFTQQWGLDQPSDADIDAPEAWDIATGDAVVIAIIDSGVDSSHREFRDKLDAGWNFDNNNTDTEDYFGHGAAVASVAAANTSNAFGMAGVCWGCRIMPLVGGIWSAAADALVFAADNDARVVNISQGTLAESQTFALALGYAYDAGVIVVASSGNDGVSPVKLPARYPEIIAVGATDSVDRRVEPFCFNSNPGSNYGPRLDLVAPGDLILVADSASAPGGTASSFYNGCGSSFSSPMVAGVVGVMESVYPSIGREEVRHLLRAGAEDQVGRPGEDMAGFDPYMGWGRLNMHRTLQGTESAVSLRVAGGPSTRVYMDVSNPLADSYDFIRGNLASVSESWQGVDLADVVCLENDSPDPDTTGNEDTATPPPGVAFFYLARFNGSPGAGSYGGSTRNRDRVVVADPAAGWIRNGDHAGAQFGYSVAGAGDVNNDTFADVIVGADLYSNDQLNEGGAFLYLGSADGLQLTPAWHAEGNQSDSTFGRRAGSAGDVNGDGYDDVIIGAQFHDNGQTNEGRAYLYLGSDTGPSAVPDWIAEGNQGSVRFGNVVAPAGDLNGDGFDDVVVTAPYHANGHTNEGRAYVYYGSSSGLEAVPWTFEPNQVGARLGFGAGGAGDINDDGYDDLVLGAFGYTNGETEEGRVFVFLGSDAGPVLPPTTIEINTPGARFGRAVTGAGDVNGDGYDDVIAGATMYTGGEVQEGAAFVFLGSSGGIATSPAWSFEGNEPYARLGTTVDAAGDVNGDGYADVIVGGFRHDSSRADEGGAWVFFGSPSGLSADPDWIDVGGQSNAWYGFPVAAAGNVNGDQSPGEHPYDEIIVGAYGYDDPDGDEGRAFLYYGSASGPETAPPTSDCDE